MKKRENEIKAACRLYMQILENQKKIVHHDRINSGETYREYTNKLGIKKRYRIKGCRAGTADSYAVTNHKFIWIEYKDPAQPKLDPDQITFRLKMEMAGHLYWIITSKEKLISAFGKLGIRH